MKIMILAPGSWVHTRRLLNLLIKMGQEVIFVDKANPRNDKIEQFKFLPYPNSRGIRFFLWLGRPISKRIAHWTILLQLHWIWRQSKADLVHLYWVDKRAYESVQAKLHPLVLSVLGSDINKFIVSDDIFPEPSQEDTKKIGKVLAKADLVLVDSKEMIAKCQYLSGGKAKVRFLPVGIDTKHFATDYSDKGKLWRNKLQIEAQAIVMVSIRALNPIYNHHLILQAYSEALPYFKTPTYLILKEFNAFSSSYTRELCDQIKMLGINANIRWIHEPIDDYEMPILYALADLIINFPAYDAFPVSFVEAAASARPVISCSLPAYQDTFASKYFRMTNANTVKDLCDALIEFVNRDWEPNDNMLKEARDWIQENYDEKVTSQNLLNIYRELAKEAQDM